MSDLLVDLGNTRLKWTLAGDATPRTQHALAIEGADIVARLDRAWSALDAPARAFVASVAPRALDEAIAAWLDTRFAIRPTFVSSPAAALGVRNAYAEPTRLGVDRFLALAALHSASARDQVLIGVGTATTLDALAADGEHLGGWILPSPVLMRSAVLARTARVGESEGAIVDFASTSADALRSGSVHAAVGAIERFVDRAAQHFGHAPARVLTGGGADELAAFLGGAERSDDLVLRGLALWAAAAHASESPPPRR